MRSVSLLRAVALLTVVGLTGCSGASDLADRAREAVEAAGGMGEPDASGTYPQDGVLTVTNDTEGDLCDVHISDFDEPDVEGYDLLDTPLAPGDSRDYPYGSHADTDDHNLVATATGCDGTEYGDFHFSYHHGGGVYSVDGYHAAE